MNELSTLSCISMVHRDTIIHNCTIQFYINFTDYVYFLLQRIKKCQQLIFIFKSAKFLHLKMQNLRFFNCLWVNVLGGGLIFDEKSSTASTILIEIYIIITYLSFKHAQYLLRILGCKPPSIPTLHCHQYRDAGRNTASYILSDRSCLTGK